MDKITEPLYPFCMCDCMHKSYSMRESVMYANGHAEIKDYSVECDNAEICKSWARRYKGYVEDKNV